MNNKFIFFFLTYLQKIIYNLINYDNVNDNYNIINIINYNKVFFSQHFLPVIKQLAGWDNYPSRISACSLVGACFKYYKDQESIDVRQIYKELCKDDTPMVRRTAAHNLSLICAYIDKDAVKEELLPIWSKLILDELDSVKVKAIESSVDLIKYLEKQDI